MFCVNVGATSAKAVLTRGGATLAKVEWPSHVAMLASSAQSAARSKLEAVAAAVNLVLGQG